MESLTELQIKNISEWVKKFESESSFIKESITRILDVMNENIDDTQHNYELIMELKNQIEELKQEITALKLIQIISIKNRIQDKEVKNV